MMLSSQISIVHDGGCQERTLTDMPGAFCDLYNAALQQRIEACRRRSRTPGFDVSFYGFARLSLSQPVDTGRAAPLALAQFPLHDPVTAAAFRVSGLLASRADLRAGSEG